MGILEAVINFFPKIIDSLLSFKKELLIKKIENRKALIQEVRNALNESVTTHHPAFDSFQIYFKIYSRLQAHLTFLEKSKWKNLSKQMEIYSNHKKDVKNFSQEELKINLEEWGKICNECHDFFAKIIAKLEKKWLL